MKKSMRCIVTLLIAVTLFGSLMVGCSQDKKEDTVATPEKKTASTEKENGKKEETKKTKVVWWTHQRHDMDFMKAEVEKFMVENPDIEIEYNIQTENYRQNLELSFQSGQAPDVFHAGATKYYYDRDMLAPLDEYITDNHKARFGDMLYMENSNYIDGHVYSMPNNGNIFRMAYNQDLMKKAGIAEPPKTLSEFVEFTGKITEVGKADGIYGFAMNLKKPSSAFPRSIDKIAEASGLQPYDYTTGTFDFGRMKPIILAFKEMYDKGYMFPGVEALDIDPLRSQFAEGKIGCYLSAHWEVGVYNQQFPTDVDWAATPVPVVDGYEGKGKVGVTGAGSWLGISSQSKVKDEAFRVLDYFYRDELLVEYHDRGLGFSVVPSIMEQVAEPTVKGAEFYQFNTDLDRFWETTPARFGWNTHTDLTPEGKGYADVFAAVILGATDIDEAIEDLNKRFNAGLDKAVEKGEMERVIIPDFDATK